jgi:hypothetical protein
MWSGRVGDDVTQANWPMIGTKTMVRCNKVCELRCHDFLSNDECYDSREYLRRKDHMIDVSILPRVLEGEWKLQGASQSQLKLKRHHFSPLQSSCARLICISTMSAYGPFERGSYSSLHPLMSPSMHFR